jgi:hypothetical protein
VSTPISRSPMVELMRARIPYARSMLSGRSIFSNRQELYTFLAALILYFFVLVPIVLADRYYVDDWGRALLGYSKWGDDGRPFADFLMRVVGGQPPLVDFSPLPQFGAILVLSYLSVLIARKFRLSSPIIGALAALPLGASPFFLENLSFKFDSLPMAVSILLALLPIFSTTTGTWKTCIQGALLLFASLCFYQSSLNAFIVFLVLEFVFQQLEILPLFRLAQNVGERILQLVLSLVLYRLFTMVTPRGAYGLQHSAMNINDFGLACQNWVRMWSFTLNSVWYGFRWPLITPAVGGAMLILAIGIRYVNSVPALTLNWARRSVVLPILPLIPFLWINAAVAVSLVLAAPPIGSCRVLIGFGALLTSSLTLWAGFLDRIKIPQLCICLALAIPAYTMIMFASVYGNSLKEQKNYEMRIASKLADDIGQMGADRPIHSISIEGNVGFSPFVNHGLGRFRLLGSLVSIDLRSDANGGFARTVLKSFGIDFPSKLTNEERHRLIQRARNVPPAVRRSSYAIYRVDSDLLISLLSG